MKKKKILEQKTAGKGNVDEMLKLAGSWKMSDEEAEKLTSEIREWRKLRRAGLDTLWRKKK